MTERSFKLCIEGPEAEERAKELSSFIEKEFGERPVQQSKEKLQQRERFRSVDPLALAAIVLAVPSALLAATDLVARMKKKGKIDALIQWAKEQRHEGSVTIIAPDGTAVHLHKTNSGEILDAASEEVLATDERG
jgi:hypothetical protein